MSDVRRAPGTDLQTADRYQVPINTLLFFIDPSADFNNYATAPAEYKIHCNINTILLEHGAFAIYSNHGYGYCYCYCHERSDITGNFHTHTSTVILTV